MTTEDFCDTLRTIGFLGPCLCTLESLVGTGVIVRQDHANLHIIHCTPLENINKDFYKSDAFKVGFVTMSLEKYWAITYRYSNRLESNGLTDLPPWEVFPCIFGLGFSLGPTNFTFDEVIEML
jgi:hypothetical protein